MISGHFILREKGNWVFGGRKADRKTEPKDVSSQHLCGSVRV